MSLGAAAPDVPQRDGAADDTASAARSEAIAVPRRDPVSVSEGSSEPAPASAAVAAAATVARGAASGGVASAVPQRDGASDEEELNSDDDDPEFESEDDGDDDPNTIFCQFEKVWDPTVK